MRAWTVMGIVLFAGLGLVLAGDDDMERIDVGAAAPSFRLNDQHGKAVSLEAHDEGQWTIVAFFPKSLTPG